MVLGLTRPRLRSDGSGLFAIRSVPMTFNPAPVWTTERGAIVFEATADLIGGFPGYADRGCMLQHSQLRITERYLTVDEGQVHGFGIPLTWIEGSILVDQPGREDFALRIVYRDAGLSRLFTVRFRASRIGTRGVRRSVRARESLQSVGVFDRFADESPLEPDFTLPWDQTREFETEHVIWTGRVTAPIRVGADLAPSEVWLTTKSIIWGNGDGQGINRVPLVLLMDHVATRLRDRLGTPVIYLAIGDERTGRYELPFAFDLQTPPDRNFRERGAFLIGLRSRGVASGMTVPYYQPWNSSLLSPESMVSGVEPETATSESSAPSSEADKIRFSSHLEQIGQAISIKRRRGLGRRFRRVPRTPMADMAHIENQPELHSESLSEPDDAGVDLSPVVEPETADPPLALDATTTDDSPTALTPERTLDGGHATDAEARPEDVQAVESTHSTDRYTVIARSTPEPVDEAIQADQSDQSEDVVLAEWSAPDEPEPSVADLAIAESWVTSPASRPADEASVPGEDDVVIAAASEMSQTLNAEPTAENFDSAPGASSAEQWVAVRRYEETAVGALSEALRVIDDLVAGRRGTPLAEHAPSAWEQSQALAELNDLVAHDRLAVKDGLHRKERILALGEICVRLRTLIELQAHGYLSLDELDTKRAKLVHSLSTSLAR